jgi:hypothetical protein
MKCKMYLLIGFLFVSFSIMAQKKDSLKLVCPLNNAVEPPKEKEPYSLGVKELKIVLASSTDSIVKACTDGVVTTIMRDDDNKWIVMFNHKDYYFVYTGVGRVTVARGQRVKSGEAMGINPPGDKLEVQLYDFETPLDPKQYLTCK